MRHYEIVFMVNSNQEEEINEILNYYKEFVLKSNGYVHRLENWGNRTLIYPIKKIYRAYYILMNVQVKKEVIKKLESNFRFNDIIIRNMIIRVNKAITVPSQMIKIKEEHNNQNSNNSKS